MKIGILIGRFQVPEPHEGHRFLFNRILEQCDFLFILVGSANRARSICNPYTFKERANAIARSINNKDTRRTFLAPLNDYLYNDPQWMADVAATISTLIENNSELRKDKNPEITLYGHFKEGNDYLKWFPQFKFQNIDSEIEVSGTELRNSHRDLLPAVVQEEYLQYDKDVALFANYPYHDCLQSNCGDAVVECLGHVLLIQRPNGTWALPGGHKTKFETFQDCAIRELYEETNLRVPEKVLRGSIVGTKLFDSPSRSSGYVVKTTLAVHIKIKPNPDGSFPRTSAADDAIDTKFVPIATALNEYALHDDHGDIISIMAGVLPVLAINNQSIYQR